jgi:hypothetical protein
VTPGVKAYITLPPVPRNKLAFAVWENKNRNTKTGIAIVRKIFFITNSIPYFTNS